MNAPEAGALDLSTPEAATRTPAAGTAVPPPARIERRGPLEVMTWPAFHHQGGDGWGVDLVVTTRAGGVSAGPYRSLNLGLHVGDDDRAVIENRRRAAGALGLDLDQLVFCNQTHGRGVAVVGPEDRGRGARTLGDAIEDTDALVTGAAGVGLVMMAADCTPIVLHDPVAHVLGCVHSGWRGTTARVAAAAIDAMTSLGARPHQLVAALGPTVEPAGYQVGPEVAEAVDQAFADPGDLLYPDDQGRWRFDLWAANTRVLAEAGVPASQIHRSPLASGAPSFFSDRAQRPCGRMAAITVLRQEGGHSGSGTPDVD